MENTPKRVGEIQGILKPQDQTGLNRIVSDKLSRKEETKVFMELWDRIDNDEGKMDVVNNQTKGLTKTEHTVKLAGRINIEDEPGVVGLMIKQSMIMLGGDSKISIPISEIIIDNFEGMSLQDFALFIRKLTSGKYQVYGKPNVLTFTQNLENFYKSVNYNYVINKEAEHIERKRLQGSRDLPDYYSDIKPQIVE